MAIPQSLINYQYTGSCSPRVLTEQISNYEVGLEMQQVLWGIYFDSYETYIGDESAYPSPGVKFIDPGGNEIAEREEITQDSLSYKVLLELFVKYPLDMCSVYIRHLIALLTPKFSEAYIPDLYVAKGLRVATAIFIWLLAGTNLLIRINGKEVDIKLLVIAIIIFIPGLLQLFGAPELRFFIGVHFTAYFYALFYMDLKKIALCFKQNKAIFVAVYLIVFMLWIGVLSSILENNQEKIFLINDSQKIVTGLR